MQHHRLITHQAALSMGFSRQEYWSGLPFPSPGDLPDPGIQPASPASPIWAGRFFTTLPPGIRTRRCFPGMGLTDDPLTCVRSSPQVQALNQSQRIMMQLSCNHKKSAIDRCESLKNKSYYRMRSMTPFLTKTLILSKYSYLLGAPFMSGSH